MHTICRRRAVLYATSTIPSEDAGTVTNVDLFMMGTRITLPYSPQDRDASSIRKFLAHLSRRLIHVGELIVYGDIRRRHPS